MARHIGADLLRDKKQDLREVSASFTRPFRNGRSLCVPVMSSQREFSMKWSEHAPTGVSSSERCLSFTRGLFTRQ